MNRLLKKLYIIVPCYNEAEVLPITSDMFLEQLLKMTAEGKISDDSRIMFVDDGSSDSTWDIIKNLSLSDPHFIGIRQSRNRGHQSAVLAGLMEAKDIADLTITIDCDGQDDITAMERMVDEYYGGNEIVYGVRCRRDTDSLFKRFTAQSFYKLLSLLGAEVVYNHADYRLLSSRILRELDDFKEVNLFLRGLIPLIGFKSATVEYSRSKRLAGKSHYPLSKMLSLAFNGITNLSVKPIRIITTIGAFVSILSFIGVLWAVAVHILNASVPGWASIICVICFMGGVQLIALGVIGEYIGKIYLETKQRPRYIISERTYETQTR